MNSDTRRLYIEYFYWIFHKYTVWNIKQHQCFAHTHLNEKTKQNKKKENKAES